jgi:rhamnose utilization protein RhaD (predicted bifunctional aldolase and dehydrogenase)/NAD(P)-dependent dehydrogenase (short-subunit alcohol dehydrogenase family)
MKYLKDLWDVEQAEKMQHDPLDLLRYRSNLLGADLRITNFGGGNTSSKFELPDPFTGRPVRVLAVKGSGGDLGSSSKEGFAILYLDRLEQLQSIYRGELYEDEMVSYYSMAAFGINRVAPSIDTPLHAFLPFPNVDHLHPDWAIALAASANGREKMEEFNRRFHHKLSWLPWQRPGFELGLMLKKAVTESPDCDGIILGGHGLFTWGDSQHQCYLNSLRIIDELGEFVGEHEKSVGDRLFGGQKHSSRPNAQALATLIFPFLRGKLGSRRRSVGHFNDSADVVRFVNSADAPQLAKLGTSCPDHFVRTKICPLYVDWDPAREDLDTLKGKFAKSADIYRQDYEAYYHSHAQHDSPSLRDPNPTVILIPGLGMFTFAKDKKEARITAEFYVNAIHVMAGATALGEGAVPSQTFPQVRRPEDSRQFSSFHNYVALPHREAFRIEYWALEEAKLRRTPPEKEFSRRIFLVVGGGSGIGQETVMKLAERGAHIMVADLEEQAAGRTAQRAAKLGSKEAVSSCVVNLAQRESIANAIRQTVQLFGGLDGVVNTAAIFLSSDPKGNLPDEKWRLTLDINITGNYLLANEAQKVMTEQGLPASIILTSSANAIVPKRGSEAYDVSKSAVSHLVRELAVGLAPLIRVNGISPATVVAGSSMFPRDRVISSLTKYQVPFDDTEPLEELRNKLAEFYARRTLTALPIRPEDCAEAICWLAGERCTRTTGHLIPIDGGLVEAFLR